MPGLTRKALEALHQKVDEDPATALRDLEKYERDFPSDPSLRRNAGGFRIDIGTALQDKPLTALGIASTRTELEGLSGSARRSTLYNVANGCYSLHQLERAEAGFRFDPDGTPLVMAQRCYREALGYGVESRQSQAKTLINYGNCLSALGRSLEAMDQYRAALLTLPANPMALGNLGMELSHFANVARDPTLLDDAAGYLESALEPGALDQYGEAHMRSYFERVRSRVEERRATSEPRRDAACPPPKYKSERQSAYAQFCLRQNLFLNLRVGSRVCRHSIRDGVTISVTTSLDDEVTFPRLTRSLNEMKESFATARLLLFESTEPMPDPSNFDVLTSYVDNLDCSVHGVSTGKLKQAFQAAFNLLDKMGFFINDYLRLGISERVVDFSRAWREPGGKRLKSEILATDNRYLFGLYDISQDLSPGGYLEHLRSARDYMTHRYLVPHLERVGWLTEADGDKYHAMYGKLFSWTLELMQLVRSAIIYVIAFVDQSERAKRRDSNVAVMPMYRPAVTGRWADPGRLTAPRDVSRQPSKAPR